MFFASPLVLIALPEMDKCILRIGDAVGSNKCISIVQSQFWNTYQPQTDGNANDT